MRRVVVQRFLVSDIAAPVAFNPRIVRIQNDALALSFVQPEIALKDSPVFPFVLPSTVFESTLPVALINITIYEYHLAISVFLAEFEVSSVKISSFVGIGAFARPHSVLHFSLILIAIVECHPSFDRIVVIKDSLYCLTRLVGDRPLASCCTVAELSLKGEQIVLEDTAAMRSTVCKSAVVCGIVLESEVALSVFDSATPLALVEICAFLCSIPVHLVIVPVTLVHSPIDEVKNSFSVFPVAAHVTFIPLSILRDEDALSRSLVIFPLSEVDISTIAFKYPCSVSFPVLQLSLIGLSVRVLNFFHILEKLCICAVDIILQEALNDALLLLLKALRVGGLHVGYSTK